ncbi:Whirlin [Orchesella cincta]|uniref:Whirlin n=1 Tax=Orchesella cincta TaxID=48709 RepID=A0A1D2NHW3_ORCCI|nr:Whirlin [Orchesella cincta]
MPMNNKRITFLQPDGSAFHSNLRAGQVLLTVDGKKLDGLTHEEIARLILDCYVDMTKSQIEFLVVEAKQNYYYFNTHQSI